MQKGCGSMANTNTSKVNIKMDAQLKADAEALFESMGMNLSTAFNIFVRQCLREEKIPFEITAYCTPNAQTREALLEAERIAKDPNVKGYTDLDELFKDLRT